jgi:hypothetical protein
MCEGLIDGETCPREVGQRTLSRIHGRERIWVREELIDGESCLRQATQKGTHKALCLVTPFGRRQPPQFVGVG